KGLRSTALCNNTFLPEPSHLDNISIPLSGARLPHIRFGLAQKSLSDACATRPFDGIIGMCQAAASLNGELTLLNQLVCGGLVDKLMFSVWIDPDPSYSSEGLVIIGGVDSSLYTGPLLYVKTASDMFWQIKLTGIRINNGDLLARGSVAVIDSGGDGIWLPVNMVRLLNDRFLKSVRLSAANEAIHCDHVTNLPVLHFLIGRISVSLGPEYYTNRFLHICDAFSNHIVYEYSSNPCHRVSIISSNCTRTYALQTTTNGQEVCRVLLKESTHELAGYTVLGIPLLRKFYTFDREEFNRGIIRNIWGTTIPPVYEQCNYSKMINE
ncbi:eukaryotic aspartyl protease, partial [Opisthorchis viverrini]